MTGGIALVAIGLALKPGPNLLYMVSRSWLSFS